MKHPIRSTLVTALIAGFALSSHAADGPTVTISGFGTAALTMSDTNDAEYARPNQESGVGKSARTGVDSNFGIQATAKVNDWLSFTAQGLVRKQATDHFGASLAWAFAKLKVHEEIDIRVGRIGAPVYMISDFRNVGYANTMIRPPAEVYRQITGDSFDGADIVYQHTFGDTTVTAQFGAGNLTQDAPGNSTIKFRPGSALHVVAEHGPFTFRVGRANAKFSVEGLTQLTGLVVALRRFGLDKVADDLNVDDARGTFTSAGFTMDYKNFLIQGEYAVRRTDTLVVMDTSSYYTMLGYRYGKVTPYYYYGNIKQDDVRRHSGMPASGPLAPLTAGVNTVIQTALQSTNAIGVRWDFHKSAALKVQMDRIKPRDGAGAFVNPKPGFTGPVNVYAAGIDFVF